MLMAVDEVRRASERCREGCQLRLDLVAKELAVEPSRKTGAEQLRKREKHVAVERAEMHGERPERCRQCHVQSDRAARARLRRRLERLDLAALDRRSHHHYRRRVETAAFDQVADGAIDARADAVIVGAEPDPPQRRGRAHSAAVLFEASRLEASWAFSVSKCFSLCSATK